MAESLCIHQEQATSTPNLTGGVRAQYGHSIPDTSIATATVILEGPSGQ